MVALSHPDENGRLLEVRGLSVDYGESNRVVDNIDFSIDRGEIVALVGGSGSGKTTILRAVLGLLPQSAQVDAGMLRFQGQDLMPLPWRVRRKLLGRQMALVPQDPTVSLSPVVTVGRQIGEVLRQHGTVARALIPSRVHALLDTVGIDNPILRARQYPHELSGGMRQRVLIAIAIAADPPLIVADEPTSGLDVTVQRRILDQFERLVRAEGRSVLLVTHDLGVAYDRADRVLVLQQGRVVEAGAARKTLRDPVHPYTRTLLSALPRNLPRVPKPAAGAEGHADAAPIIAGRRLQRSFPARGWLQRRQAIHAVADVSLAIRAGRTTALVGESGSGKSTTARMLAGLEPLSACQVLFDGQPLVNGSASARRRFSRDVQFVYQYPYASLDPRYSVARLIAEPLQVQGHDSRLRRQRIAEVLDAVELPLAIASRTAQALSGGQLQRVAIARALATKPRVIILDEPVSALDVAVQATILALLAKLQQEFNIAYLLITHDLAVVRALADEIHVMSGGRIVESGLPRQIFGAPRAELTRQLLNAIPGSGLHGPDDDFPSPFHTTPPTQD